MKNLKLFLYVFSLVGINSFLSAEEITPYTFESSFEEEQKKSTYIIPSSSRYVVQRVEDGAPGIIYYVSKPKQQKSFPIAILCPGSTQSNNIDSVIHFHRYFLQEFLDLGMAVITVEQWGVDGHAVDKQEFMAHYTRSQRLQDHQRVIEHLFAHPLEGWNGKFVLLGVSEGGTLVTNLTECYSDSIIATINWSGAGDLSWQEELWAFIEAFRKQMSWYLKLWDCMPAWVPFSFKVPKTKNDYDVYMQSILPNPSTEKYFMGMTYKYHVDAMLYLPHDYKKIRSAFLVVSGAQDSLITSSDAFVQKAQEAGAPVTYMRIEDMDHYIRHRFDIIKKSFEWLREQL